MNSNEKNSTLLTNFIQLTRYVYLKVCARYTMDCWNFSIESDQIELHSYSCRMFLNDDAMRAHLFNPFHNFDPWKMRFAHVSNFACIVDENHNANFLRLESVAAWSHNIFSLEICKPNCLHTFVCACSIVEIVFELKI